MVWIILPLLIRRQAVHGRDGTYDYPRLTRVLRVFYMTYYYIGTQKNGSSHAAGLQLLGPLSLTRPDRAEAPIPGELSRDR